ncbi:hypothetical protein LEP1GSC040_3309 [Leptospira santarosai str. 2000030832]|nr:hypothetical protein LEP1GSC040_3309 [Leptospira santarosai str. 2000030832]
MELAFAYFMRRDGAPKDERRRGVRAEISIRKKPFSLRTGSKSNSYIPNLESVSPSTKKNF